MLFLSQYVPIPKILHTDWTGGKIIGILSRKKKNFPNFYSVHITIYPNISNFPFTNLKKKHSYWNNNKFVFQRFYTLIEQENYRNFFEKKRKENVIFQISILIFCNIQIFQIFFLLIFFLKKIPSLNIHNKTIINSFSKDSTYWLNRKKNYRNSFEKKRKENVIFQISHLIFCTCNIQVLINFNFFLLPSTS